MICFDRADLKQLFEAPSRERLAEEVLKSGMSSEEMLQDKAKMQEIIDRVKLIHSKEDLEIFSALYMFPNFYPEKGKICFLLKNGIDPQKNPIDSLNKLKASLKEDDPSDFQLMHDDGCRSFQLKAYRGATEINEFFEYLKKKLAHYGNNLGDINLLITMQSQGDFTGDFFQDLHERLKTLDIKGGGHVLVSYNEDNKFDVINTVYPTLGTTRLKHEPFA